MLLDVLDSLPRLRISGSIMNMILWLLDRLGVKGVPCLSTLRKMQALVRQICVAEPTAMTSSLGNNFTLNSPITSARMVCIKSMEDVKSADTQ
jgi:hypothetical protein